MQQNLDKFISLIQDSNRFNEFQNMIWPENETKLVQYFQEYKSNTYLINAQNQAIEPFLNEFAECNFFGCYLDIRNFQGTIQINHLSVSCGKGTLIFFSFAKNGSPIIRNFFSKICRKKCYGKNFIAYTKLLKSYNIPLQCSFMEKYEKRNEFDDFIKSKSNIIDTFKDYQKASYKKNVSELNTVMDCIYPALMSASIDYYFSHLNNQNNPQPMIPHAPNVPMGYPYQNNPGYYNNMQDYHPTPTFNPNDQLGFHNASDERNNMHQNPNIHGFRNPMNAKSDFDMNMYMPAPNYVYPLPNTPYIQNLNQQPMPNNNLELKFIPPQAIKSQQHTQGLQFVPPDGANMPKSRKPKPRALRSNEISDINATIPENSNYPTFRQNHPNMNFAPLQAQNRLENNNHRDFFNPPIQPNYLDQNIHPMQIQNPPLYNNYQNIHNEIPSINNANIQDDQVYQIPPPVIDLNFKRMPQSLIQSKPKEPIFVTPINQADNTSMPPGFNDNQSNKYQALQSSPPQNQQTPINPPQPQYSTGPPGFNTVQPKTFQSSGTASPPIQSNPANGPPGFNSSPPGFTLAPPGINSVPSNVTKDSNQSSFQNKKNDQNQPKQPSPILLNNIKTNQAKSKINKRFWDDLESIVDGLLSTHKIDIENSNYSCKICNEDFDSYVHLISHCWNEHKGSLNQFFS